MNLRTTPGEWLLAACVCISVLGVALLCSAELMHWFIFPVLFCGILMASDVVAWARGRLGLFDPAGLLGIIGTHFFFVAPLLQVALEYRTLYITDLPEDYRPWLGGMAVLNGLGLMLYRRFRSGNSQPEAARQIYVLDYGRFSVLALIAVVVAGAVYAGVLNRFGGLSGYVEAVGRHQDLEGFGLILMFAEALPIVAFMWCTVTLARSRNRSWITLGTVYAVFLVLVFMFEGLRGSRGNTVYSAIWGAGIIHFYNRRLNRMITASGALFILAFMYVYGFYKDFGTNATDMFASSDHWEQRTSLSARTPLSLLLGDFGRSDIHALMLSRLMDRDREVSLGWGRTYLAALTLIIPKSVWPDRPVGKTEYLTDLEYGSGMYKTGIHKTSHAAGIAGEAMLNFGWFAVVPGLALWGVGVRAVRRVVALWAGRDSRGLLVPYMICLLPLSLMFDSENLVFECATKMLVPVLLIVLSSRYSRSGAAPVGTIS